MSFIFILIKLATQSTVSSIYSVLIGWFGAWRLDDHKSRSQIDKYFVIYKFINGMNLTYCNKIVSFVYKWIITGKFIFGQNVKWKLISLWFQGGILTLRPENSPSLTAVFDAQDQDTLNASIIFTVEQSKCFREFII